MQTNEYEQDGSKKKDEVSGIPSLYMSISSIFEQLQYDRSVNGNYN